LVLFKKSKNAAYYDELRIELPTGQKIDTGPAAVAFLRQLVVYMPHKKRKLGWPFKYLNQGGYEPTLPQKGWTVGTEQLERFRSVLCVPVGIYESKSAEKKIKKTSLGVLNFSTRRRDPFVDRDFLMGQCFASILALAMETYRRESRQQQKRSDGGQAPIIPGGGSPPSAVGGGERHDVPREK
jgi:hypothetical protein